MSVLALKIAMGGGLWIVFAIMHWISDWFFQSDYQAMNKHNNVKVRAVHCVIYTLGFVPLMWVLGFAGWEWVIGSVVLFGSHMVLDTYVLVFLWAKYIRRPPEMTQPRKETYVREGGLKGTRVLPPDAKAGFVEWVSTPLGKILLISIDQLTHVLCLLPLVWMVMRKL